MIRVLLFLTILVTLLLYMATKKNDSISIKLTTNSYMENVEIIHKGSSKIKWIAKIKEITFPQSQEKATLNDISINFVDKEMSVKANRGFFEQKTYNLHLLDNVYAFNEDMHITGESAFWDMAHESIKSSDKVEITGKTYTVKADAMEALKNEKIKLTGNVRFVYSE